MSEKKRYCICRSTDAKSFMIACDKCEEWFHGKCIKITPEAASNIRRYYCTLCQKGDPSLKIKYKKPKSDKKTEETSAALKRKAITNNTSNKQKLEQDTSRESPVPVRKKPGPKPKAKTVKQPKKTTPKATKGRKPDTRKSTDENTVNRSSLTDPNSKQCNGPRCVNAVRVGSKYCSDDCGMKLAAMRLVEIMPTRIRQWQSTPCIAEQNDRKQLDEIKEKMLEAKHHLEQLDEKHKILDKIVERGKKEKVKEEESEEEESNSEEEEDEDMEVFIYCVTCGHEVNQRNAIKHMEKCFIKAERDMSFAGAFKSLIGGDVICDHYNAPTKSYCKRLRVICPEHSKEPKVADDEMCGCPLTKDIFTETAELCKTAKKHCVEHFKWERLRRAEIDADKVRQWMKIDELFEKERLVRAAMTNRAGVMGLLLHQTVDHEALQSHHHKLHTPIKPESRSNVAKSTVPSSNTSKDISKMLATDESSENTTMNQQLKNPSKSQSNLQGSDNGVKDIANVTVRPPPVTKDQSGTLLAQAGQTDDHGYSVRQQPAPSKEHDYC